MSISIIATLPGSAIRMTTMFPLWSANFSKSKPSSVIFVMNEGRVMADESIMEVLGNEELLNAHEVEKP